MVYVMLGALYGAGFASFFYKLPLTTYLDLSIALGIGIYLTGVMIRLVRPRRIRRFRRD
jgi:hypothetical protein